MFFFARKLIAQWANFMCINKFCCNFFIAPLPEISLSLSISFHLPLNSFNFRQSNSLIIVFFLFLILKKILLQSQKEQWPFLSQYYPIGKKRVKYVIQQATLCLVVSECKRIFCFYVTLSHHHSQHIFNYIKFHMCVCVCIDFWWNYIRVSHTCLLTQETINVKIYRYLIV